MRRWSCWTSEKSTSPSIYTSSDGSCGDGLIVGQYIAKSGIDSHADVRLEHHLTLHAKKPVRQVRPNQIGTVAKRQVGIDRLPGMRNGRFADLGERLRRRREAVQERPHRLV